MHRKALFIIVITLFTGFFYGSEKLNFEFTERVRYVTWDNAIDLDNDLNDKFSFTRQKTTFSLSWKPLSNFDFKFKLTNENRVYFLPENRDFNVDEIIFDQLFVKLSKLFGLPFSITAGRQNIIMGEGFVLLDYHPLDGSRSVYFNALRADYKLNTGKITLFYGFQDVNDDLLPIINSRDKNLIELPEEGFGVYYSGIFRDINIESYYIRKNTKNIESTVNTSGINTYGLRSIIHFKKNISLTTEAAFQTGYIGDAKRSAFGGYYHLDYNLSQEKSGPVFTLGGIYLSGDDQKTEKHEGWDPLFSRWPKWSESYIYTLIKENGVANWSNLTSLYAGVKINVSKKIGLNMAAHLLNAPEYSKIKDGFLSGAGRNRGVLFTSKLNVKLNSSLTGHMVFETFKPGNFYLKGASSYHWLRFELLYKFKNK